MSKQRVFLLACFILSGAGLFAQSARIEQGFGLAASTTNVQGKARAVTDTSVIDSDYRLRLLQFGIVYLVRVDFLKWKFGSISIGSAVTAGLSGSGKYSSKDFNGTTTTTVEGVKGTHFSFNIPVFIDCNFGLHSADDEYKRKFGFYLGAGYGYSYTKIKTSIGKLHYDGFDPVFRSGIRMGNSWERRVSIGFNIRGALQDNPNRTYELQILKEL